MSDRKYRQRGYMDNNSEPQRSKPQQPKAQSAPRDREGPRSPKMMASHCSQVGMVVSKVLCPLLMPSR